ncbi:MAG: phenylalanine--tRNA ligase subunit alpha [Pseudomonadota bacterium]
MDKDRILALQHRFEDQIQDADKLDSIEEVRIHAFGKKGLVTQALKELGSLEPDTRREMGILLNQVRDRLNQQIAEKKQIFVDLALENRLAKEKLDLTLPVANRKAGLLHPIHQTIEEIANIFGEMGFVCVDGPDIEDDFHNFKALNFADNHPARLMHDSFYLKNNDSEKKPYVLRTHTSPVQIRTMLSQKPPIRVLAPGRTYRCDSDMTHTPMFHQVEGLAISQADGDDAIDFGHLKGCLSDFCQVFFDLDEVPLRFRPSYFPFTEPSVEVDIRCKYQNGQVQIGQGDSWLEILGAGMTHREVLVNCQIDPDLYQGFAFGLGVERLAMLKYGMSDLRQFFENDVRWLTHYGFGPLVMPSLFYGLNR